MAIGIEKLSARNQLKGTVTAIEKGTVSAKVKIDMGGGVFVTSSIRPSRSMTSVLPSGTRLWRSSSRRT